MQYVGSKGRLSKELAPIIQSYIFENTRGYLEPFVGGANMIDKINHEKRIGCDIHEELIELLKFAQSNIDKFPKTISEEEYHLVRQNKDNYPKWYVGLVGFCGSFGAKYFGGFARRSNRDDVPAQAIRSLVKQSINIKNVNFINKSFLDLPLDKIKGYVIYCDPPYKGTLEYKNSNFPYDEFYKWCIEASKNNIVLISEYSMPEQFKCIWSKELKTTMGSGVNEYKDDSNVRVEKLFIVNSSTDI